MGQPNLVTSLATTRVVLGVSAFAAPRLAGQAFRIDADANPQAPYLARLFGARDAALGIGVLTSSGDAQRRWLRIGTGCDVADALAGIAAGRAGYLPKPAAVLVTAAAVGGIVLGVL